MFPSSNTIGINRPPHFRRENDINQLLLLLSSNRSTLPHSSTKLNIKTVSCIPKRQFKKCHRETERQKQKGANGHWPVIITALSNNNRRRILMTKCSWATAVVLLDNQRQRRRRLILKCCVCATDYNQSGLNSFNCRARGDAAAAAAADVGILIEQTH